MPDRDRSRSPSSPGSGQYSFSFFHHSSIAPSLCTVSFLQTSHSCSFSTKTSDVTSISFLHLRHFCIILTNTIHHFRFFPPPTSLPYFFFLQCHFRYRILATTTYVANVSYLQLRHFRIISTNTSFPFSFLYLHHFNHFNKISSISFLHLLRHFRIMSTATHSVGYLSSS